MPTESITSIKACSRCGEVKPLSAFFRRADRTRSPGYRAHCKACHNASRSTWTPGPWHSKAIGIWRRGGPRAYVWLREALGDPVLCYLCGDALVWEDAALDHIVPTSRGGAHAPSNLAWTHKRCNSIKADMMLDELQAWLGRILDRLRSGWTVEETRY